MPANPSKARIEGGYDKAFWTIVDAHVTTLITSFALFLFGTGPIKGFAVTLCLGIILNLFTTLFGTRVVYDFLQIKRKLKKLSFFEFFKQTNIDFMGWRNYAFIISGPWPSSASWPWSSSRGARATWGSSSPAAP